MAVRLRIDARDLKRIKDRVEGWEERAKDLSPVLKGRAEVLRTVVVKDVFGGSQSPSGAPWQPLAQSTVQRRRQGSNKPLINTGLLRGSITASAGPKSMTVGVSGAANKYAVFHQLGTKHIPARPFIPTQSDLDGSGPAAQWAERAKRRIVRWILQGKK